MSNDNEVLVEQTIAAMEEKWLEGKPYVILPSGSSGIKDMEPYLERPLAHRGDARMERVESFVDYVNAFKTDTSALYISGASGSDLPNIVCIFDDRSKDVTAWSRFKAGFRPKTSRQLETWNTLHCKLIKPAAFAQFINRNRTDVVDPEAAVLMEILRDIRGTANVEFNEAVDEHTGAKSALYAEKITLKGGKGNVQVPTGFTIAIPIYERQKNRVKINCHLRAEVIEGKVNFCLEMDQLEEIKEAVVDRLVDDVVEQVGLAPYYGDPA